MQKIIFFYFIKKINFCIIKKNKKIFFYKKIKKIFFYFYCKNIFQKYFCRNFFSNWKKFRTRDDTNFRSKNTKIGCVHRVHKMCTKCAKMCIFRHICAHFWSKNDQKWPFLTIFYHFLKKRIAHSTLRFSR